MSKVAEHDRQLSEPYDHSSPDDSSPVMVVVVERQRCWLGWEIEYNVGQTLLAIMSEDPACWQDVPKYWPRYSSDSVCEAFPVQQWAGCDEAAAWKAIAGHGNWLLFDLLDKRVITGEENQKFERDATLVLRTDAQGKQRDLLPIHLPPWWEFTQQVKAGEVSRRRVAGFSSPRTDRELLYGARLLEDLASRIVDIALAGRMPANRETLQPQEADSSHSASDGIDRAALAAWYDLTAEVHRDWLMTPRDDLAGGKPRDLLHGAHEWANSVIEGQRLRFTHGSPMVAAPQDVEGYAHVSMGSEEMIVYFDLCREVIQAGWYWVATQSELKRDGRDQLVSYLQEVRDEWLELPFEGGAPPRFIIECSRRRVPRGGGVAIAGMQESEPAEHPGDCDCPICNMLDSGMFGTCFTCLDGHHLELDDEFAFSMFEKFEDWEEQSSEWREISEAAEDWEPQVKSSAGRPGNRPIGSQPTDLQPTDLQPTDRLPPEEFDSAWSSLMSDGPLPGDRRGYLKLAFRLAEIIADLESVSAPHQHIVSLNQAFRCYFESDSTTTVTARAAFKESMEEVAGHYPHLLPKLCDLQSQVDELERRVSKC